MAGHDINYLAVSGALSVRLLALLALSILTDPLQLSRASSLAAKMLLQLPLATSWETLAEAD